MRFEWDQHKNELNKKKHGLSFEEAVCVFSDKNLLSIYDENHSHSEDRWITLGNISNGKTIIVVHTERIKVKDAYIIRIISARNATKNEMKQYYSFNKGN